MPVRKFMTAQLIPWNGRIYDEIARSGKRYTQKEINDLIWIIRLEKNDRTGEENIKRNVLKAEWRKFMNFVFQLDMCTCGGWERNFVSFSGKNKKTLIIHLFSSRMSHSEKYFTEILSPAVPPKGFLDGRSEYYKSLSLFDTDFSLLTQKPRHKMFVEHKNVCYHRTKYLGERNYSTECLFHLMMTTKSLS